MNPHAVPAPDAANPAPANADDTRQAVWTRHWASGAAHSCAGSYGAHYGGALARFWASVLAPMQAGQRVLDIATGSGALPRLIGELRPEIVLQIDAIDLAAVAPAWVNALPAQRRQQLRFHARQAAEQLPFADRRFDLVISQYGLEYSDLDRSLPELLRVLAPQGRVALLLHHTQSRPVALAAVELAHIEWLVSGAGLLPAAQGLLEPMARAATPQGRAALARDAGADAARERFNTAQDNLRTRAAVADGADVLFEVQDRVAGLLGVAARDGLAEARRQAAGIAAALNDARLRLQELRSHALTPALLERLCVALRPALGPLTVGEVHEQGHLMGWTVVAGPGPACQG